jgi:hypothetical protein
MDKDYRQMHDIYWAERGSYKGNVLASTLVAKGVIGARYAHTLVHCEVGSDSGITLTVSSLSKRNQHSSGSLQVRPSRHKVMGQALLRFRRVCPLYNWPEF